MKNKIKIFSFPRKVFFLCIKVFKTYIIFVYKSIQKVVKKKIEKLIHKRSEVSKLIISTNNQPTTQANVLQDNLKHE